jgi:hypothetical protein
MENDFPTPVEPTQPPLPPVSPASASRVEQPTASVVSQQAATEPQPQSPPPAQRPQAPEVQLTAIPADGERPVPIALEPDADGVYRFGLECLPGADAVHLLIDLEQRPRLRAEVRARAGDPVRLELRIDESGEPVLRAGNHRVLFLPVEREYESLPPLLPPKPDVPWDICLLIDATMRYSAQRAPKEEASAEQSGSQPPAAKDATPIQQPDAIPPRLLDRFLLEQPEPWAKVVAPVVEMVRRLGESDEVRLAVITFADEPPTTGVYSFDLAPRFHLQHLPPERQEYELLAMMPDALEALLTHHLTASPGMDFVDAVGDALAAAHGLQWRDDSRRLVILIGDSPGHSTARPIRYGGDALARTRDVDTEAMRLHRDQAEILTIYHPPKADARKQADPEYRDLFDYARDQYRRLASQPELALTTADLVPQQASLERANLEREALERAIAALKDRRDLLGRGACWGRLVPS